MHRKEFCLSNSSLAVSPFPPERRICFAEMVGETTPGNPQYSAYSWHTTNVHLMGWQRAPSTAFLFLKSYAALQIQAPPLFKSHLLKWLKTIHQGGGAVGPNLCLCWKWNSWAASSLLVLTKARELDMVLSPCFLVFNSSFLVISD